MIEIKNIKLFDKGKRGVIYTGNYKSKKVAIKVKRPESEAKNRILNEGKFLEILNKKDIGPKLVYYDKKADALFIEFYMVTESNLFCKIQYSAPPDIFNKLRPSFEELKDSFKFKFGLY